MKNKIVLVVMVFIFAGTYSATAQSKQQNLQQKWQEEMQQRKKHHDEIVAKAEEQKKQLQSEKKPEQVIMPVQQQPQIKTDVQHQSPTNVADKKDDNQPVGSKKIKPTTKSIKKEEID